MSPSLSACMHTFRQACNIDQWNLDICYHYMVFLIDGLDANIIQNRIACAFAKGLTSKWKDQTSWAKTAMAPKLEAAQTDFAPSSRNLALPGVQTSLSSIPAWRTGFGSSLKLVWLKDRHLRSWELVQVRKIVKHCTSYHRVSDGATIVKSLLTVCPGDTRWRAQWPCHCWHCSWNPLQPSLPVPAGRLHLSLRLLQQEQK